MTVYRHKVETFTPEELGWVRIAPGEYKMPDGTLFIFPPNHPEVVERVTLIPMFDGEVL